MYGPGDGLIPVYRKRKRKRGPGAKRILISVILIAFVGLLAGLGLGLFDSAGTSPAQTHLDNSGPTLTDEADNSDPTLIDEAEDHEGESPPFVATAAAAELTTEQLVDVVGPAVVSIVTETVSQSWFFQATPQRGAGTGAIISPDGYIITNNHVVEGADKVTVTLSDGRTFKPTNVTTDPQTDLAVVKIDASDLPYLHFLNNSLEHLDELDHVVAVGNALALPGGPTWTLGVVSNLGRSIDLGNGVVLYDLIQTDAAINPGNSGGPLVNMAGQIVGINVAIAAEAENIGFAISTDTAVPVVQSLVEEGQVVRPFLGVSMLTVNSIVAYQYGLSVDEGALIVEVSNGSPADEAGLEPGDVVTGIDGQVVNTAEELRSAIQAHEPGDQVEIEYYRGSEPKTTTAVLGKMQ